MGHIPLTLKLHMGVTDLPYSHRGSSKRQRKQRGSTMTTGQVATIIEAKYGLMNTFFNKNEKKVKEAIDKSLKGAFETMMIRKQAVKNPLVSAQDVIATDFKDWVTQGGPEKAGISGVPTKAAIARRSLRFKKKKSKGKRPSFVDTGLMVDSAQVWFEES